MRRTSLLAIGLGLALSSPAAWAQQGGPVAILMPGAGGVHPMDFLVRNQGQIRGAGIETRVTTSSSEAAGIARAERQKGRKVVIVGMSKGTLDTARALAAGAPANGAVFVAGNLRGVASILGSPASLPPALVVHHRNDACDRTPPSGVGFFQGWGRGRVSVRWIATQGSADGRPCGPRGAHGFYMQDGPAVSAIVGFIRSR
jgi:hypothetical protein